MDQGLGETKERILIVASDLFARFGYDGTSVRDIAADSGVNVAAINYHFGNKHNLFWAVVKRAHDWVENGIREISLIANTMEDLATRSFDFMMANKNCVRTALRIMLADGVPLPEGEWADELKLQMGPPGMQYFVSTFHKQYGDHVSDADVRFVVRAIFSNLIHSSMICSSSKVDLMRKTIPGLDEASIRAHLAQHASVICKSVV